MKTLYCPVCQKPIQRCECGDGCAVCAARKAVYALQVCGDCVELPAEVLEEEVSDDPGPNTR